MRRVLRAWRVRHRGDPHDPHRRPAARLETETARRRARGLGLRHAEVVSAVTVNAAAALGLAADRGQIASGFRADLVSWSVSDWREVAYWMGGQLVTAVWTGGSACPLPAGPVSLGLHVKA